MFSRFLKGVTSNHNSTNSTQSEPKPHHVEPQHVGPEEHIAKAIKCASESDFVRSLSHLTSFAASWNDSTTASSTPSTSSTPPTSSSSLSQHERVVLGNQLEQLNQTTRRKIEELLRGDEDNLHKTVCNACKILSCLQTLQQNRSSDNDGLDIYLDFLEKIIHKEATEFMKLLVEDSDLTTTASNLGELYSLTSLLLQDSLPLVSYFSSDAAQKLITRVHNQCSLHVTKIFDLLSEELNLRDTVQQLHSNHASTGTESTLITNPLQLDETLQTISLMCAYSSRYTTFVQSKLSTVDCSALQACVQVMLGNYLPLESFYIESAMGEAMKSHQDILLSTPEQTPSPTSSPQFTHFNSTNKDKTSTPKNTLVDDGFFVLKKSLRRALSTMSPNVACAVFNSASMALDHPYFSSFQGVIEKLSVQPSDIYLDVLNDLELTSEYIVKLQRDLTDDVARLFTNSTEKTKLIACLDDMVKSSTNICNKLRTKNLLAYADRLNVKIDINFQTLFRPISYELDENSYEHAEINDPFMLRFIDVLGEVLSPIQRTFRETNRTDLALHIAKFISTKLESAVLSKRFTSLGAVQLSKEVRQLGDYFVSVGGQSLRYQFTRLAQISQLLNLDRVIDCMEYWIEGKSVFKLDATEVKQVLMRRVDFSVESINALKL